VLMSLPSKHIRSIQDLRGKRIGMHNDGNRALQMVLALEGIALDDVHVVEVSFALDHLSAGRCDALQGYAMTEPIELEAMGEAVDVLPVSHERLQPYAQAYFASNAVIASHGDVLQKFLAASHAGWRAVLANPDQAARIIADMMGDPAQAQQQRKMLERLLPLVAGDLPEKQIGTLVHAQWQRNLATYYEHGLIDRPLALHDVLDASLLDFGTSP
jgi:NitT/TauT family transport system substrate-binding protein